MEILHMYRYRVVENCHKILDCLTSKANAAVYLRNKG